MEDKLNMIQLSENSKMNDKNDIYLPSQQSANVLFKFITKLDYLKEVIKHEAIIPRYYEEIIEYLNIKEYTKIAFPMSCFCDIHLNKLVSHMNFYGYYGIGLNKEWGIKGGVQPIQYINSNSSLLNDYKLIFKKSLKTNKEDRFVIKDYSNYLLTNLMFMKPLEGKMLRNGKYERRNFHDEREWRYVPNMNKIDTELPLIIPSVHMNVRAYIAYSNAIKQCSDIWLKYQYENIKYIIVKSNNDRLNLIRFIKDEIMTTDDEKFILISKILVFEELEEDW